MNRTCQNLKSVSELCKKQKKGTGGVSPVHSKVFLKGGQFLPLSYYINISLLLHSS